MKTKNTVLTILMLIIIGALAAISIFGIVIKDGNGITVKTYIKSAKDIKTGLDISGGLSMTYQAISDEGKNIEAKDLEQAKAIISKRLEKYNIYDYNIRLDYEMNQLYLEIPEKKGSENSVTGSSEIVQVLTQTAKVEFVDPDGNVVLSGSEIESASYSEEPIDSTGIATPHVVLKFSDEGREKFSEASGKLVGKTIAIKLDGQEITAPVVNSKIDSPTCIITLNSSLKYKEKKEQATEYAMLIDSGSLPVSLDVINQEYIGPSVGEKALNISVKAALIAIGFICIFMIIIYRLPGFVASIALVCYSSLVLLFFTLTGTSITLAGIAGLILSLGMAVDANVIIFERLKEELKQKISYKKAFELSFKEAMSAIIDGNVTTFVVAILLYVFGTSSVKGFGLILAVGVLLSLFTATVVTKTILSQFIPLAEKNTWLFGVKKEKEVTK